MLEDIFTTRLKEADMIAKLNDICEENTATTRCSTAVWDNKCNQITHRHFCHKICKFYLFNNAEIRHKLCDKDDLKFARKVIETAEPQRYVCWSGFTCFMVPIIVYDTVVGLISIGEFLTVDSPTLSTHFFDVVKEYALPRKEIELDIKVNVPVFNENNVRGLITSTEFLGRVIADILMGEISLSFDFDLLVRKYISLQEQNWQKFSSEELSGFLILKNIIKLQNLFLKYALRKIDEEKKINLHKTLMPYQMIVTAAENLRAGRHKDKSYKQIISTIKQVEEYTLKSMRGISLSDTQWLAIKEKTAVNLNKLLHSAVKAKKPLLEYKNIKVTLPSEWKRTNLWGRESDLDFLFSTLIENAINSIEAEGGRIDLSIDHADGAVTVTCTDNGCGIDPDEIDKIFDPGFRGRSFRKSHTAGTGLGLSLAKHITNAHGGHIKVQSTPGVGTTLEVIFPSYALGGTSHHD